MTGRKCVLIGHFFTGHFDWQFPHTIQGTVCVKTACMVKDISSKEEKRIKQSDDECIITNLIPI